LGGGVGRRQIINLQPQRAINAAVIMSDGERIMLKYDIGQVEMIINKSVLGKLREK